MLPEVTIPEVHGYDQIFQRARERAQKSVVRAALVTPSEPDMLRAVAKLAAERFIEPVLVGDERLFEETCREYEIDFPSGEFVSALDPVEAVARTCEMMAGGRINLVVKGKMLTGDLLKCLFHQENRFQEKDRVISHVAVLRPERYKKLLMVSDGAVNVAPDLKTKLALVENMVRVSHSIGVQNPRIAFLAAVEVIYPQMQVTMEAAIIAKMWERGQIKGAMVDGPLSFDVAVDMFAAHSKGVKNSPVAGQADGMIAPNLETANGIYKAMALYGRCQMGGVVVGGKVPVALGSRSDSVEGKLNSVLLGILNAPEMA